MSRIPSRAASPGKAQKRKPSEALKKKQPEAPSIHQPLISAVTHKRSSSVYQLVEAGENPDTRNNRGLTALMIAAIQRDLASLTYLVNHHANTNLHSPRGETALYFSAMQGQYAAASWLLKHRANPNTPTLSGATALGTAIERYAISRLPDLYEETVKRLLKGNANPNQTHRGLAPLWLAAKHGSASIVELLLDAGALLATATYTIQGRDGTKESFTAIQAARESGHERLAQRLEGAEREQRHQSPAQASAPMPQKPTAHRALSVLSLNPDRRSHNREKPTPAQTRAIPQGGVTF